MKKNFVINQIYIENFKSIDRLHLDWGQNQLIVLDGPNGFGKTTIFDAVELVLTGKIDRIKKPEDARIAYSDVLLSNDPTKDLIIKVQFCFEGQKLTLAKALPANKILTGVQRQPGRWEIFDTHLLESFDSDLDDNNKIDQAELNRKFDITDLERVFSLFYYIQQQENTAFLKRPGKDRLTEISRLFDTKDEEEEKEYLKTVSKFLNKEKKTLEKEIGEISSRLEQYKNLEGVQVNEETKYESILEESSVKPWDRENIVVPNRQTRDKFIEELLVLDDFIIHFDEYEKANFNKKLTKFADDKELLKYAITGASFITDFQVIRNTYNKEKRVRTLFSQFQEFRKNIFGINFAALNSEIDIEIDLNHIIPKVESLKSQERNISQLSNIVNELNFTREKLLVQMNNFHKHEGTIAEDCPFCGYNWGDHERLLSEIQAKKDYFSSMHDETAETQNKEIKDLFDLHLKEAYESLKEYLSDPKFQVVEFFYRDVEKASNREKEIFNFIEWCGLNAINITHYFNVEFNKSIDVVNLEHLVEELSLDLKKHKKQIKEGYSEIEEKFKLFDSLFKELFKEKDSIIKSLSSEKIERKKQYIDYVYYHQNNEKKIEEETKLLKYQENHRKLVVKEKDLNILIGIYDTAIKNHWNKIMIDIEIPFYIFSGKIIQNYQRGIGFFIKEKTDTASIIFVSDINSDHDALNYLSSGQLSAIVISFALALNKIYGHNDLGILLIDDPVQTMDEINMASLSELLRNDFSHKQIIISTHESDVSRYLQYKFSKYGLDTASFNMREKTHVF
ncbi:hypothetical protein CA600_27895 [Paenibacillus sp. VTT E-133280]|uniref:AAA family ATPase n=1 Tax=Paenibacillus sp. VTT E-133280 TaxID=1986222 RepID=UPI000BA15DBA|nr:AAA family ATPase [Paenibacillus sp. VTT E-133280]OZQ60557.1 hypothetical protein CA600_27895 [Paenibacillus sp. VTT E-133280]